MKTKVKTPGWVRMSGMVATVFGLGGALVWFLSDTNPPHAVTQKTSTWTPGPSMEVQPITTAPVTQATPAVSQSDLAPTSTDLSMHVPMMVVWGAKPVAPPAGMFGGAGKGSVQTSMSDASDIDVVQASILKHPEWMLSKNVKIPCILQEPINTQLGGHVTCIVDAPQGIKSMDGSHVLIDNGAQFNGNVIRGVSRGQVRLAIVWDDMDSANRVHVRFKHSSALDTLGQTGVPGEADEHWWEIVKGAVMFTALDTASNVASNVTQREGSANIQLNQGSSLAQQAVQNSFGQVQPTIGIPTVGTPLLVQLNDYTSFENVYKDQLRAQ